MKMKTFCHDSFNHRFVIIEEQIHFGTGKRYVMQQTDQRGNFSPGEVVLTEEQYQNALQRFDVQGWKQLLVE
jgi:hypothetical protein